MPVPRLAPGAGRAPRRRKCRRRLSEQRRLSACREFHEAKNKGLAMRDPNFWTLEAIALKFKLKSPNPGLVLHKHLKRSGVNLRAMANREKGVQEEVQDLREMRENENSRTNSRTHGRVGNCGRKRLTEEQKDQREALALATADSSKRHLYENLHAKATELIAGTSVGSKTKVAEEFIKRNFDPIGLKAPTVRYLIRCASEKPGHTPRPPGGAFWSREEETLVRDFVQQLRVRKLHVSPALVLAYADVLVPPNDPRRDQLGENGLTKGVWPSLARRVGVETGTSQNIDTIRARWGQSVNFKRWYENFQADAVREGLAKVNPDYDPENPHAQPRLVWLRPEAIGSGDETDMSLGSEPGKTRQERGVF